MQAAIYARISKDAAHDGLGVERQRADCAALAGRLGWTVAATYVDDDRSAYSGKPRPAYRELLASIDAGNVGAILAWHPDRLHRSPKELESFIDLVERRGTAVQTVTAGAYDLTSPTGRMQARIVGNVARYESEHKSERLRRKMDELVAAGQPHTFGTRPFGWHRVGTTKPPRFEIDEREAELIREAAAAIVSGASVRSIVADWRSRGIVSPAGKPWQPSPLARMLTGSHLAGIRERQVDRDPTKRAKRRGEIAVIQLDPALFPAIIEPETLQRLRSILRAPGRLTTQSNARVNLLAGFVRCGRCHRPMIGRPRPDGVRRYVCPPKSLGGCNGCAILAEPTEAYVAERIALWLDTSPAAVEAIDAEPTIADDPLGERAEAEARMAELAAAYAKNEITRGEWQAVRAVLAERVAALPRAVTRPTIRLPENVRAAWPGLSLEERRRIVGAVVDHVTIGPAVHGRNRFDTKRISLAWRV